MASTSLRYAGVTQAESRSASDLQAPDSTWGLLLVGLFAVWAIATYGRWDENAEPADTNEQDVFAQDGFAEHQALAMHRVAQDGEWTAAEQKLARIPPASETRAVPSGQSRVA